jgi:hypothetical protein
MTPSDVLVCRFQPKPPTFSERLFDAALILVLVGLLFSFIRYGWNWGVVLIALPAIAVVWLVIRFFARQRETQRNASIEIDSQRAQFTFRNFRFVSTFLPEKPRPEEVVRFNEVVGAVGSEVRRGTPGLQIRTAKGTVLVSSEMENFSFLEAMVADLVEANLTRADEGEPLPTEPEIRTAWYGWLILLVAVGSVAYLGWKFMYAEP